MLCMLSVLCVLCVCASNVVQGIKLGLMHERQMHPLLLSYALDQFFFMLLIIFLLNRERLGFTMLYKLMEIMHGKGKDCMK